MAAEGDVVLLVDKRGATVAAARDAGDEVSFVPLSRVGDWRGG